MTLAVEVHGYESLILHHSMTKIAASYPSRRDNLVILFLWVLLRAAGPIFQDLPVPSTERSIVIEQLRHSRCSWLQPLYVYQAFKISQASLQPNHGFEMNESGPSSTCCLLRPQVPLWRTASRRLAPCFETQTPKAQGPHLSLCVHAPSPGALVENSVPPASTLLRDPNAKGARTTSFSMRARSGHRYPWSTTACLPARCLCAWRWRSRRRRTPRASPAACTARPSPATASFQR